MKKLVIFIDSGDTLVNESTEIRNDKDVVIHAELIEGAKEVLKTLYDNGHTIALVADGLKESFDNIFEENGMGYCFSARAISETLGDCKPAAIMFETALRDLGLTEKDKHRIIMVGNNVERDIVGANRFGITSVLQTWTPRYRMTPENELEVPHYKISKPLELLELVEKLEKGLNQA